MDPNSARELLLLVLLVKILAAASIASILGRSASFKGLLFRSEKSLRHQFIFGFVLGTALLVGVALRVVLKFPAPDLGLEGAVLAGVLYGNIAGMVAGGLASLPALAHQEILALPLLLAAGALGGFARSIAPSKDIVWHFSPFFDLNLYRWFRQRFGYPRGDWQMFFFLWLIVMEASRILLGRAFPAKLFYLYSGSPLILIAICLATIASVAIPLTIWKNIRVELQLEEQGRLLMQA
ncbi:MAG: sensor histidine kinase, partial [Acidobacteria bacterium]|nr:sensor histidine kinase [Acidobacteriota bacterium]